MLFPPSDMTWDPPKFNTPYNQSRREGAFEYSQQGRGWRSNKYHKAWWRFIMSLLVGLSGTPFRRTSFAGQYGFHMLILSVCGPLPDFKIPVMRHSLLTGWMRHYPSSFSI